MDVGGYVYAKVSVVYGLKVRALLMILNSKLEFEIVIVEDNSPDGTLQVAEALQKEYGKDRIVILARKGKLGLGSAYMDGLKKTTGNFVVLMDADMSHHVRIIRSKHQAGDLITLYLAKIHP